jgi:hypothetical protein
MVTVSCYPVIQRNKPHNNTAMDDTPCNDSGDGLMASIIDYVMIFVQPVKGKFVPVLN